MTMFLELELLSFEFWISGPKISYLEKKNKRNFGFWSIHVEYPVCKERKQKHMLNVVFMLPGDSFSNATKEC